MSVLSHSVVYDSLQPHGLDCQAPLSMEILQARILERVAISSSRGSSQSWDRTQVSCIAGRFFTVSATREALTSSLPGFEAHLLLHLNPLLNESSLKPIPCCPRPGRCLLSSPPPPCTHQPFACIPPNATNRMFLHAREFYSRLRTDAGIMTEHSTGNNFHVVLEILVFKVVSSPPARQLSLAPPSPQDSVPQHC